MIDHNPHHDPELQPIADQLDRLAHAERTHAPHHLEDSVFASIEREVFDAPPMPLVSADPWFRNPLSLGLAASVALVAALSLIFWMSAPQRPIHTSVVAQSDALADVEEFIATVAWLGAELPDFSDLNRAAQQIPGLDDDTWHNTEETLLNVEESI